MYGISSSAKDAIARVVETVFDNLAFHLIGNIPRLKGKKMFVIDTQPKEGLAHLFIQAMNNRAPNTIERDALKGLLDSAYGYIESLKAKTRTEVAERIDAIAREARTRGETIAESQIQAIIAEEMEKAGSHMKLITESESTKMRNLGTAMDITRRAASVGDEDPTVFFIVIRDGHTCKECVRLHLNPDGTPRVWKFTELKQGYHKRSEDNPSAFGLHPHCRCTLAYLSSGFGFDQKGMLTWKKFGHDEYRRQRSA